MSYPEKNNRNEKLFSLWLTDPRKWSFSKLGKKFAISKITAYAIVRRELNRRGLTLSIDKS